MGLKRYGEDGAVGKYTGKIKHSPKKIYQVFDFREDYRLNIQNMRKIYLLGFPI